MKDLLDKLTGKVIVIAQPKGGVGKSTTAVNIAKDFASYGKNVLLVDVEDDGTTLYYQDHPQDNLTVISGYDKSFPLMLDMYRKNYDAIIIDTAGVNADMNKNHTENLQSHLNQKVLCKSDFILIPVPPTPIDIRKSVLFFAQVENYIDASMGQRKAMMFINKAKTNTKHTNEARNLLDGYSESIPLAKVSVRAYMEYETAEGEFLSVNQYAPNSNAALDMRRLQKELLTYL